MEKKKENSDGGSSPANAAAKTWKSLQKGVPWTEEEHQYTIFTFRLEFFPHFLGNNLHVFLSYGSKDDKA